MARKAASNSKSTVAGAFPPVTAMTATQELPTQIVLDLFSQGLPITHAAKDVALRKSNAAIEAISTLDLLERKILDACLFIARPKMFENTLHSADIEYFKWLLSFDSQNHGYLKLAITKIQRSLIQINIIDEKHPDRDNWQSTTFLYDVGIANGRIFFRIPESIRPALMDPKSWTYLSFRIKNRFSSQYAYIVYERCRAAQFRGATQWWSLDEFREKVNVSGMYPQFQDLYKRVIKPAIEQINLHSDIFLTVDYQTRGRTKTHIRFIIEENPNVKQFLLDKENLPTELFDALKNEFGFSNSQIDEVSEYGLDDLKDKIEFTRYRMKKAKKKIDRPDLYLMKALKEDLRFNETEKALFDSEQKMHGRKKSDENQKQEDEKAAVQKSNSFLDAFKTLGKEEQQSLIAEFTMSADYEAIKPYVGGKQFTLLSPIVRAAFAKFLQADSASLVG